MKTQFEGPYRVKTVLNAGHNFSLHLKDSDRSHNNFHISKLKLYHSASPENPTAADIAGLECLEGGWKQK